MRTTVSLSTEARATLSMLVKWGSAKNLSEAADRAVQDAFDLLSKNMMDFYHVDIHKAEMLGFSLNDILARCHERNNFFLFYSDLSPEERERLWKLQPSKPVDKAFTWGA